MPKNKPNLPMRITRSVSRDPAYMKDTSYCHTLETRDLGIRPTQQELKAIWERSQYRLTLLELQGEDRAASSNNRQFQRRQQRSQQAEKKRKKNRPASLENVSFLSPDAAATEGGSSLTSASNAEVIRQREVLQGEFGVISSRHVERFEQDSAFKKDRVETPETMAVLSKPHAVINTSLGVRRRQEYGM